MMYLGEADHGRPGLLGQYSGGPLPSMLPGPYSRGTPSLASSILTSASTSPRSVSSSLHYRYNDHVQLTNSPPLGKLARGLESFPPTAAFNSPYVGSLGYLPKSAIDDYRAPEDRHAEWTPPHAVRNSLQLPAFSNQYGAYAEPAIDDGSSGSDFHSYHGSDSLDYPQSEGLVPVHPHFQRS